MDYDSHRALADSRPAIRPAARTRTERPIPVVLWLATLAPWIVVALEIAA